MSYDDKALAEQPEPPAAKPWDSATHMAPDPSLPIEDQLAWYKVSSHILLLNCSELCRRKAAAAGDKEVHCRQLAKADAQPEPDGQWAVIEVMGHRVIIGSVRECTVADAPMLHVERPDGITQLIPPSSLFCITDVTEEVARKAHERQALGYGLPHPLTSGISFDGEKYTRGLPSGDPASPWRPNPWGDDEADGDPDPWGGDPLAGDDAEADL